eukprot:754350-Hanusia_phi.AAC.3
MLLRNNLSLLLVLSSQSFILLDRISFLVLLLRERGGQSRGSGRDRNFFAEAHGHVPPAVEVLGGGRQPCEGPVGNRKKPGTVGEDGADGDSRRGRGRRKRRSGRGLRKGMRLKETASTTHPLSSLLVDSRLRGVA